MMSNVELLGFRAALLQLTVTDDKASNVANAIKRIQEAKKNGCKLAILPECFNSPYNTGMYNHVYKLSIQEQEISASQVFLLLLTTERNYF